ncbi:MAG: flippase-like domain-containing protein [Parachlamydiales bacterium]|nr:flippase-like domain-containing protein [Parachlamydiales bacterium]
MKKKGGVIFAILNIGFVFFIFFRFKSKFDWGGVLENINQISYPALLTGAIINVLLLGVYGARLALLIEKSFATGLAVASVGHAANQLIPFRLGEIFRIFFARSKFGIQAPRLLLALFCERISDLFSLFSISIFVFFTTSHLPINKEFFLLGVSVVVIFAVSALFLKSKSFDFLKGSKLYKWKLQLNDALLGKKLWLIHLYTGMIWFFTTFSFYVFFKISLPEFYFGDAVCLTLLTTISFAFSAMPGNIGIFEGGIVYYLTVVRHVDSNLALAAALAFHLLIIIPQILLMALFLVTKNNVNVLANNEKLNS